MGVSRESCCCLASRILVGSRKKRAATDLVERTVQKHVTASIVNWSKCRSTRNLVAHSKRRCSHVYRVLRRDDAERVFQCEEKSEGISLVHRRWAPRNGSKSTEDVSVLRTNDRHCWTSVVAELVESFRRISISTGAIDQLPLLMLVAEEFVQLLLIFGK